MINVTWRVLMSNGKILATHFVSSDHAYLNAGSDTLPLILRENGYGDGLYAIAVVKVTKPNRSARDRMGIRTVPKRTFTHLPRWRQRRGGLDK